MLAQVKKLPGKRCYLCDHRFVQTLLCCPSCNAWQVTPGNVEYAKIKNEIELEDDGTILLSNAPEGDYVAYKTGPWDDCFSDNGGIVLGGVYLLGGPPGAGKSTIALQLSDRLTECEPLADTSNEILYVAAEQGLKDLRPFANRLQLKHLDRFRMIPIGSDANLPSVIEKRRPKAVIIDSLQGFTTDALMQSEICKSMKPLADRFRCPTIIISQVNKGEDFAGFMSLQHDVDATIKIGVFDDYGSIREIAPVKNRYGPTQDRERYFHMTDKGLVSGAPPWENEGEEK